MVAATYIIETSMCQIVHNTDDGRHAMNGWKVMVCTDEQWIMYTI